MEKRGKFFMLFEKKSQIYEKLSLRKSSIKCRKSPKISVINL
jgi:hypothetical protein